MIEQLRTATEQPQLISLQPKLSMRKTMGSRTYLIKFGLALLATSILLVVYAEGRSWLFLGSVFALSVLATYFVIVYRPSETLNAAKITSLLYVACFGYGPLWLADKGNYLVPYYGAEVEGLMGVTASIALAGYILFLVGYFIFIFCFRSRLKDQKYGVLSLGANQRRFVFLCSLILGVAGGFSYIVLVFRSGGIGYLLTYSGSRADIFGGVYGGWFWGMHLLFAAYGLFALIFIRRHPWVCLLLALAIAAAFVPFQGRDIVIAPIFCWLLFFHSLRRPLRWRVVVVGAVIVVLLSAIVAAFRGGGNKLATENTGAFFSTFLDNANRHLIDVVALNIEQLDSAMIAVHFVDTNDQVLGPAVFTAWFKPIDRLFFGDIIPSIQAGVFMDRLVMPEHRGWNTAISPSIIGELYIGLGWLGVLIGMPLYGGLLGLLVVWRDRYNKWPLLFAGYPFAVYMVAKIIVDGSVHAFRPLIIFLSIAAFLPLIPSKKNSGHRKKVHE